MAACSFCQRKFRSPQAVKAHLKHCKRYHTIQNEQNEESGALGKQPKAETTPVATAPFQLGPQFATPDLFEPLRELLKSVSESSTKPEGPPSPQQRRRKILQAAKEQVIDHYRTSLGQVTAAMRGAAKAAIERELASIPLEELPFPEVLELAAAIRDRLYAPAFRRQAREAERQDAEKKARRRKEVEELGALIRAARRKESFIQQASHQAQAYCEEKAITGWEQLSVVGDIESRLTEFLTGDESITEAQAIVRSVLDARFAEAEAKHAAVRAQADAKWRGDMLGLLLLGTLVGLLVLAFKYPAQALPILSWIERTFGLKPTSESEAKAQEPSQTAESPDGAAWSPRRRRRQTVPVTPPGPEPTWGDSAGV